MNIIETELPGVLLIEPKKFGDHRGFFSETFKRSALVEAGVTSDWVQDNQSYSTQLGVVRGLHFQRAPHAQAKIVRVTRGAVLDVVVDIRRSSAHYGRHVAVELSAENWRQIYVPPGFAHGFCTLTEEVEALYKVDAPYAPELEGGLMWDDPDLAIAWPINADQAVLSERDRKWPAFRDFISPFA